MQILRKPILTITFILLSNLIVNAQNIKIADLLNMYKKATWEDVNSYVATKGWAFFDAKEESEIQWSYKKSNYNDKAEGWLYLKVDGNLFESIRYQITNQTAYTKLVNETKLLGFKKIKSEINDGTIVSKYSNGKYIISAWISKESGGDYDASYSLYQIKITKIRVPVYTYNEYEQVEEEAAVDNTIAVYEKKPTEKLYIGKEYEGGKIFHIDESGRHGLIVTLFGHGRRDWHSAKYFCEDLVLDGYSDWRLPTIEELDKIYENRIMYGMINLYSNYWSSTEVDETSLAKCQSFDYYSQKSFSKKELCFTLAIRNF